MTLAPVALLLGAGCTEILNIDVIYDNGGGGSGAGVTANGGNGASVSDGGNGTGAGAGNGGSPPLCETPPAAAQCFADEFEGAASEPCWEVFNPHGADIEVDDGELKVQPITMNAAWWIDSGPLGLTRGFFQHRNVAGDFAMVAKAKATDAANDASPPSADGSYKMAGIFMRRPPVDDAEEDWVKLEVGFRGPGLLNGKTSVQPMGILGGVARGASAAQLHPYQEPVNNESWLGMCRDGNNVFLMFRYIDSGDFLQQLDQTQAIAQVHIDDCMEVGLIAGGYTGPADIEGHFQQFRLVAGNDLSFGNADACSDMLVQLADTPAALGCAGCQ